MGVSRVFWDTNLFIYLLEDIDPQSARVAEVRERMLERDDELCTSTRTLGEVLNLGGARVSIELAGILEAEPAAVLLGPRILHVEEVARVALLHVLLEPCLALVTK